ncbi:hypothetical protein [Pseudoxanthomonas broegbernensis]|nr:hypothetical protein [Pseudoxanthomonas broegbernensis]
MSRSLCRLVVVVLSLVLPVVAGAQSPARNAMPAQPPVAEPPPAPRPAPSFRNPPAEARAMESRPQQPRSMSEAVRRVQRSTGGQILGAEQVPFEGRSITRIKYMDDHGRVRYMDDPGPVRAAPRRGDHGDP